MKTSYRTHPFGFMVHVNAMKLVCRVQNRPIPRYLITFAFYKSQTLSAALRRILLTGFDHSRDESVHVGVAFRFSVQARHNDIAVK